MRAHSATHLCVHSARRAWLRTLFRGSGSAFIPRPSPLSVLACWSGIPRLLVDGVKCRTLKRLPEGHLGVPASGAFPLADAFWSAFAAAAACLLCSGNVPVLHNPGADNRISNPLSCNDAVLLLVAEPVSVVTKPGSRATKKRNLLDGPIAFQVGAGFS